MLRFYLEIPFIKISTEIMCRSDKKCEYTYIAWLFEIYKWRFQLNWGKSRKEME